MKIADVPFPRLCEDLAGAGVAFRVGPYAARLRSPIRPVADGLALVGAHHSCVDLDAFIDFDIEIRPCAAPRPLFPRDARVLVDGFSPFKPFAIEQSYAMFEWSLNWCIATRSDRSLLVHSAVIERGGKALLLPAPPGSGKSTLCAALVCRGWRLLSDEVAVLTTTGELIPIPRPVSLKNASIDVIRRFTAEAVIGGTARETLKGTVAYMRPPADSIDRQAEPARPRWIVFPKYESGAALRFEPYSKARTLVYLAHNSFNYHIHGARGFELLGNILDHCDCYNLSYGSLEDALTCIEGLAATADQEPLTAA